MKINVMHAGQGPQLQNELKAVATRVAAGDLTPVELAIHPAGVPAIQHALALGTPSAPAASTSFSFSLDASLSDHVFGAGAQVGMDFSPWSANAQAVETSSTDPATGVVSTRKVIEGAVGGAALSALWISTRSATQAIPNPALATVALAVMGAVAWPYVSSAEITHKADGSIGCKIGFQK